MLEIKNSSGIGRVQIAGEVIAIIAGTAVMEVDGVAGTIGNTGELGEFAEKLGIKNLAKGVKVDVEDSAVSVGIHLVIKYGYKIQEVSEKVQSCVKQAIETMTGLSATEINIHVSGVHMPKQANE